MLRNAKLMLSKSGKSLEVTLKEMRNAMGGNQTKQTKTEFASKNTPRKVSNLFTTNAQNLSN